jgi:hypothetical protein
VGCSEATDGQKLYCFGQKCLLMGVLRVGHIFINPFNAERLIKTSRSEGPLNIKIPSKNMREKPTNTPIIHSFS